jgi:hypothetical protein
MVLIADDFRAHWEAADEFRKLAEVEESAAWLWMLHDPECQNTSSATSACVEADRSAASGSQPTPASEFLCRWNSWESNSM